MDSMPGSCNSKHAQGLQQISLSAAAKRFVRQMMEKLGARSGAELERYAVRNHMTAA